jgi:glycerate 2-kinase
MDELIRQSIAAALAAANPREAIHRYLALDGDTILINNPQHSNHYSTYNDLRCVALGKASVPMALAVADLLGDKIPRALVVTKYEHLGTARFPVGWIAMESGHPHPDNNSLVAGDRVWNLLTNCTKHTLIIACISGGASALVAAPKEWSSLQALLDPALDRVSPQVREIILAELFSQAIDILHPEGKNISLAALQAVNNALLNSGLDIQEINHVRSQLDRLKGGGLVVQANPGQVVSLILSDVIGDPIASIASGMTDRPTAHNTIVGNNRQSCEAVAKTAQALGYTAHIITTELTGEAQERGREIVRKIVAQPPRTVLLYGGETTVTIPPGCQGQGGRNQELALAAAIELSHQVTPAWIVTLATDGTDGPPPVAGIAGTEDPPPAAGAIVNEQTIARSIELGLDAQSALDRHDSYPFLDRSNALLLTEPTGTNVADIIIAIRP